MEEKLIDENFTKYSENKKKSILEKRSKQVCLLYFFYAYINVYDLVVSNEERGTNRVCKHDILFDIQTATKLYSKQKLLDIGSRLFSKSFKMTVSDSCMRNKDLTFMNFLMINLLNIDLEKYAYRSIRKRVPFIEINIRRFFKVEFSVDSDIFYMYIKQLLESSCEDGKMRNIDKNHLFNKFEPFFKKRSVEKICNYIKTIVTLDRLDDPLFVESMEVKTLPSANVSKSVNTTSDYDYNNLFSLVPNDKKL